MTLVATAAHEKFMYPSTVCWHQWLGTGVICRVSRYRELRTVDTRTIRHHETSFRDVSTLVVLLAA